VVLVAVILAVADLLAIGELWSLLNLAVQLKQRRLYVVNVHTSYNILVKIFSLQVDIVWENMMYPSLLSAQGKLVKKRPL
jgi:hypothetical protein